VAEAVTTLQRALQVRSRERAPELWAQTEINLAAALEAQAKSTIGPRANQFAEQAVAVYREVLGVLDRERSPEAWGTAQNGLGQLLWYLSEVSPGEESEKEQLREQSLRALMEALKVRTRERTPEAWAETQENLGIVLQSQGETAAGEKGNERLGRAVTALRQALEVRTRERLPQLWAQTQVNLGAALRELGSRTSGPKRGQPLAESAAALHRAEEVLTRETLPARWATVQFSLGRTLLEQGLGTPGPAGVQFLQQAEAALHRAQEVFTRESSPAQWAAAQRSLSEVQCQQALTAENKQEGLSGLLKALNLSKPATELMAQNVSLGGALDASLVAKVVAQQIVIQCIETHFRAQPDDERAFWTAASYQDITSHYEENFALLQAWSARHPADGLVQAYVAIAHVQTGRFAAGMERIRKLLAPSGQAFTTRSIFYILALMADLGQRHKAALRPWLQRLRQETERQPANAHFDTDPLLLSIDFFVRQDTETSLAPYRDWLLELMAMALTEDRASRLSALDAAISHCPDPSAPPPPVPAPLPPPPPPPPPSSP
jgi:tetratricopeptide (TPR) repeat protein